MENNVQEQNTSTQLESQTKNFIAIAIILGILAVGAVYSYLKIQDVVNETYELEKNNVRVLNPAGSKAKDPVLNAPESDSDNPVLIEKDLEVTDLDAIDKELEALDNL